MIFKGNTNEVNPGSQRDSSEYDDDDDAPQTSYSSNRDGNQSGGSKSKTVVPSQSQGYSRCILSVSPQ